MGCSPWGRKESGTTERLTLNIIIVPCTLTTTSRVRGLTGSKESSFYHWANLNLKSRDVLLYNPTPVSSQLQAPEETDKESTLLLLGPASSSLPVEIQGKDTTESVVCHRHALGVPTQARPPSKRLQGLFMETVKTAQGAKELLGMVLGPRLKTITRAAQEVPSGLLVAPWRTKAQSGQPWRAAFIQAQVSHHPQTGGWSSHPGPSCSLVCQSGHSH